MLLKLPVELVQRIVRLSTPEEITSSTYQPRQDTLRNLCLVNSLLLAVTQPVLEEALWVKDRERWEGAAAQLSKGTVPRLRFLWVNQFKSTLSEWKDIEPFLSLADSVRELRLCRLYGVKLSMLAGMSNLVRLSLYDVSLVTAPTHPVLASLEDLTRDTVSLPHPDTTSFLAPSTLPSLRALAHWSSPDDLDACDVSPELYLQLLCVVFIDGLHNESTLSAPPSGCEPFVSSAGDYYTLQFACRVRFGRIRALGDNLETTSMVLSRISDTIVKGDHSTFLLSRLSLPVTLYPSRVHLKANLPSASQRLVEICENRNVEVVFEDGEEELGGSFLPLTTIEYAKKLRAEQAAAGGA